MRLIIETELVSKEHGNVIYLMNGVEKSQFVSFIKAILDKQSWPENFCSCFFHEDESDGVYELEADDDDENDILWLPYAQVLNYIKIAAKKYKELYAGLEEIAELDDLIKQLP